MKKVKLYVVYEKYAIRLVNKSRMINRLLACITLEKKSSFVLFLYLLICCKKKIKKKDNMVFSICKENQTADVLAESMFGGASKSWQNSTVQKQLNSKQTSNSQVLQFFFFSNIFSPTTKRGTK